MKVGIHGNASPESTRVRAKLEVLLTEHQIAIDNLNPDIVISVGGDGTLLGAFQKYRFQLDRVRFVGLHTGHLGFYTDWREYEINELVTSLVNDTAQKIEYPVLAGKIHFADDDSVTEILALNESTVKKVSGTMVADVYLGGELFERFRGDGLTVSTPTGSTAYNKAIGGAVLHPRLEALQLAELASINNQVFRTLGSPLVIASDETIRIVPEDSVNLMVMYDQQVVAERPVKEIEYRVAKEKIAFAQYRHNEFWHRVNESFIGRIED